MVVNLYKLSNYENYIFSIIINIDSRMKHMNADIVIERVIECRYWYRYDCRYLWCHWYSYCCSYCKIYKYLVALLTNKFGCIVIIGVVIVVSVVIIV